MSLFVNTYVTPESTETFTFTLPKCDQEGQPVVAGDIIVIMVAPPAQVGQWPPGWTPATQYVAWRVADPGERFATLAGHAPRGWRVELYVVRPSEVKGAFDEDALD